MDQEIIWSELLVKVADLECRLSFKEIFTHFYPLVLNQSLKSGLSKEVASELAQETMMKVWNQAKSYDQTKGNASQWIYVIARNSKYDFFRKLKNNPVNIPAEELYNENERDQETLFDLKELRKYVDQLPTDQSDVIQKIYFEGMTQQEVSDQDNIPLGTIKSRVRLGIYQIKRLMGEKSQ